MDRRRWTRTKRLHQRALELPPLHRAAWLRRRCRGDPALAREVEALLAASGDDAFLQPVRRRAAARHRSGRSRPGARELVRGVRHRLRAALGAASWRPAAGAEPPA